MLKIEVEVRGFGPAEKVGALLAQALKDQMGASAWTLDVETFNEQGHRKGGHYVKNEGRAR